MPQLTWMFIVVILLDGTYHFPSFQGFSKDVNRFHVLSSFLLTFDYCCFWFSVTFFSLLIFFLNFMIIQRVETNYIPQYILFYNNINKLNLVITDQLQKRPTTLCLLICLYSLHMRSHIEKRNFVAGLIKRNQKENWNHRRKKKKIFNHVPWLISPKIPSIYLVRKDSIFRPKF